MRDDALPIGALRAKNAGEQPYRTLGFRLVRRSCEIVRREHADFQHYAALFLGAAVFACSPQKPATKSSTDSAAHGHMAGMSMPVTIPKGVLYTEADVHFMQGMIAHHAQAIYMSRLATSRGANPRLLKFANKIDQSQQAEIRLMQDWLVANKQSAPDTGSWRTMSMPGMLTPAQLATLDAARGPEFDKQFLNLMIQHHEGALKMVADSSPLRARRRMWTFQCLRMTWSPCRRRRSTP